MGMFMQFRFVNGMLVLMGSMRSLVFMVMHMGVCFVFMLMQVLVEVFMSMFMRMLVAVFCIVMGMFVLVLMVVRMSV